MDHAAPFPFEHWERFECNLSPRTLRATLGGTYAAWDRDGLGPWTGLSAIVQGHKVAILAPAHLPDAGASIWCAPGLAPAHVARAIRTRHGAVALFMQPNGAPLAAAGEQA